MSTFIYIEDKIFFSDADEDTALEQLRDMLPLDHTLSYNYSDNDGWFVSIATPTKVINDIEVMYVDGPTFIMGTL